MKLGDLITELLIIGETCHEDQEVFILPDKDYPMTINAAYIETHTDSAPGDSTIWLVAEDM